MGRSRAKSPGGDDELSEEYTSPQSLLQPSFGASQAQRPTFHSVPSGANHLFQQSSHPLIINTGQPPHTGSNRNSHAPGMKLGPILDIKSLMSQSVIGMLPAAGLARHLVSYDIEYVSWLHW